MKLEQALAIVRHVVDSAPGPVSVYATDDHGELVAAAPGEEDEALAVAAIRAAGLETATGS